MAEYKIKVGDVEINHILYPDRCIGLAFEDEDGIPSDIIPWEVTEDRAVDYRALSVEEVTEAEVGTYYTKKYTGEFVLEPIPEIPPEYIPTEMEKLEAQALYTAALTDTLIEV